MHFYTLFLFFKLKKRQFINIVSQFENEFSRILCAAQFFDQKIEIYKIMDMH